MKPILDNPIWNALTTRDANNNMGSHNFAFFDGDIAPFIGMPFWDKKSQRELFNNVDASRNWFLLIGEKVHFIEELEMVLTLPLYQFTCTSLKEAPPTKRPLEIVKLDERHVDEMIMLTKLTKPGPFTKRTIEFGGYYGMFEDGKLVAMGGERLHVEGYTEISAICTHPDYQGLGYAAKITHFLASSVIKSGCTPFLHARADNVKATALYKRLSFQIRKEIQFYIIRRRLT